MTGSSNQRSSTQGPWPELRIDVGRLRQRSDLAELKRRGASDATRVVEVEVEAVGLEITTSRIPENSAVRVDGLIDSAMDGIEFRGVVTSSWEGECRRCLEVVSEPLNIELNVSFLPDLSAEEDAEAYPMSGDYIDLGEVVREELMLSLPLSPLCKDGCSGADPERYLATTETGDGNAEGDDEEGDPPIDPRWAGLSALTFDEE